ncbi:MAG TPA: copper resistance CopC family protein [Steroidobacteraceae bacterium]|nr:copper resistance CopC family protein [Steroidobacteraceae bacterium]
MFIRISPLAGAALALCAALAAGPASAHARLVAAAPAANATVAAPARIRLTFSEAVAKRFSSFRLEDSHGHRIDLTPVPADARTLAASPVSALAPGRYTVSWTAVASDDGHRTAGRYRFIVR